MCGGGGCLAAHMVVAQACAPRCLQVTDAGLAHLRGLSRLETLNLAGLRVR